MVKNLKKMLAVVLALSLAMSLLTVGASASDGDDGAVELETVALPELDAVPYGTALEDVLEQLGTTVRAEGGSSS